MGSLEKSVIVLGPIDAGKKTTIGCMLFKYGGIDMLTMERFQQERIRTYNEAAKNFESLKISPSFNTPKHHVTVTDINAGPADCAILVLSADSLADADITKEISGAASHAKELVIIINKMDAIDWSEERFQEFLDKLPDSTEKYKAADSWVLKFLLLSSIPIIPISALFGDNVVDKSPKSSWFKGWKKASQHGVTLLEAIEASLES